MTCIKDQICLSVGFLDALIMDLQNPTTSVEPNSCSNRCEVLTSVGSSTTVDILTTLSLAENDTTAPANPQETPLLGFIHFGGRPHFCATTTMRESALPTQILSQKTVTHCG